MSNRLYTQSFESFWAFYYILFLFLLFLTTYLVGFNDDEIDINISYLFTQNDPILGDISSDYMPDEEMFGILMKADPKNDWIGDIARDVENESDVNQTVEEEVGTVKIAS